LESQRFRQYSTETLFFNLKKNIDQVVFPFYSSYKASKGLEFLLEIDQDQIFELRKKYNE